MKTQEYYTFNGITPQATYPSTHGIQVKYWKAYKALMRAYKALLSDDKVFQEAERIIPEMPSDYNRAIERIDEKLNRIETNPENLNKLLKAQDYIREGDLVSSVRLILRGEVFDY